MKSIGGSIILERTRLQQPTTPLRGPSFSRSQNKKTTIKQFSQRKKGMVTPRTAINNIYKIL